MCCSLRFLCPHYLFISHPLLSLKPLLCCPHSSPPWISSSPLSLQLLETLILELKLKVLSGEGRPPSFVFVIGSFPSFSYSGNDQLSSYLPFTLDSRHGSTTFADEIGKSESLFEFFKIAVKIKNGYWTVR